MKKHAQRRPSLLASNPWGLNVDEFVTIDGQDLSPRATPCRSRSQSPSKTPGKDAAEAATQDPFAPAPAQPPKPLNVQALTETLTFAKSSASTNIGVQPGFADKNAADFMEKLRVMRLKELEMPKTKAQIFQELKIRVVTRGRWDIVVLAEGGAPEMVPVPPEEPADLPAEAGGHFFSKTSSAAKQPGVQVKEEPAEEPAGGPSASSSSTTEARKQDAAALPDDLHAHVQYDPDQLAQLGEIYRLDGTAVVQLPTDQDGARGCNEYFVTISKCPVGYRIEDAVEDLLEILKLKKPRRVIGHRFWKAQYYLRARWAGRFPGLLGTLGSRKLGDDSN